MLEVYSNLEDKNVFKGNESEFIHFMRNVAIENGDEDIMIIHLSEAKDYLEEYCENLELV